MKDFTKIKSPTESNMVVSFCDLTNFLAVSSKKSNQELFAFLSEFYEFIGSIIENAGGYVIKFMGDAVLIVFAEEIASEGIQALKKLKEKTDKWLKEKGINSRLIVKVHFGPVICGYIGTKKDKKFDVFGETVNTTAILTSHGFSMTPQAFRCLDKEARTQYKKHTPPVRYIALEEHHKN